MDEPTLPVVACEAVTTGLVVVIDVEEAGDVVVAATGVDDAAVAGAGSAEAAGVVGVVVVELAVAEGAGSLDEDEGELLVDEDDDVAEAPALAEALVVLDELEALAVVDALEELLSPLAARCVAGGAEAAITVGGVGT